MNPTPGLIVTRATCYRRQMPTPIGHALGGTLAGWLAGSGPAVSGDGWRPLSNWIGPRAALWRQGAAFSLLGILPDLDLLLGLHGRYTHSLGAALLVGLLVWRFSGRFRWGLATGAAYGSHVLLDWLGMDSTLPIGVMALWPFRPGYYQSGLHVFMAISRRYWLPGFLTHNLLAIAWELVILGPPIALVWWWKRRRGAFRSPASGAAH